MLVINYPSIWLSAYMVVWVNHDYLMVLCLPGTFSSYSYIMVWLYDGILNSMVWLYVGILAMFFGYIYYIYDFFKTNYSISGF